MLRYKCAAVTMLFLVTGATAALAHAKMTSSVPKDGATVTAPVSEIQLNFSTPLRLTLVQVMRDGDHMQIPLTGELPKSASSAVKAAVSTQIKASTELASRTRR